MNTTYPITIDYSKSYDELIKAAHFQLTEREYPFKDSDLSYSNTVQEDIMLLQFDSLTSEEVLAEIDKQNYRPVNAKEFLTLAITYPDIYKKDTIIMIDSAHEDRCFVLSNAPVDIPVGMVLMTSLSVLPTDNLENWGKGKYFAVVKNL